MTVDLTADQVVMPHDEALAQFGGRPGMRDAGVLASAASQAAMEAFGAELSPSVTEKAGASLYVLARGHAFVDGNKRTAYAAAYTFLLMNGHQLRGAVDDVFALVLDTAQGHLTTPREVAARLEPLVHPFSPSS